MVSNSIGGAGTAERWRRRAWFAAIAAGGVCLVAWLLVLPYATGYGDDRATLFTWLRRHWGRPDWQHGALVPLIVGWLVYRRKDELARTLVQPSRFGLPLLVFSLIVLWVGYKANSYYFGYAGIQLLLAGLVLWLAGAAHFRVLRFPWLFLAFAWPLIFLEDSLAFQLRLLMSEVSAGFLNLVGVETVRLGTALVSAPDAAKGLAQGELFNLGVDGPCSGMRSLFALLMVSALYGYLTLGKNWKRALFFALAFPMAIFGNFVRIMILLVGVRCFGREVAIGKSEGDVSAYHMMAGIAVFVFALGGMVLVGKILKGKRRTVREEKVRAGAGEEIGMARSGRPFAAVGLCGIAVVICLLVPAPTEGGSAGVVMDLPHSVGDFVGVEGRVSEIELELLPEDTRFAKMTYRRGHATSSPDVVQCSIVLSGSDRRSIHRPEVCLTGQGWTIDSREVLPVVMPDGSEMEVMDLLISRTHHQENGDTYRLKAHYLYWFVGKDVTTASHFRRIMLTSWDNIVRNVNHRWAYPSVMSMITEDVAGTPMRGEAETREMLVDLIRDLAPSFQKNLAAVPEARVAGNL